jgi:hypothetical protein
MAMGNRELGGNEDIMDENSKQARLWIIAAGLDLLLARLREHGYP